MVNSSPLNYLLKCINDKDESINKMSSNKVLVFNIGFDGPSKYKDLHWLYVPDKSINFYRVGFYNNILGEKNLSIYVEIGLKVDEKPNMEKAYKDTILNLKKIGIIEDQKVIDYESVIMNPAYVHISKESNKIKTIKSYSLQKNGIYSIGRYGDWKYCSIEDSINDARLLAEKFNNKIN